jgi:hypothetical protein
MDQNSIPNCPVIRFGQIGAGSWSAHKNFTAKISPKRSPQIASLVPRKSSRQAILRGTGKRGLRFVWRRPKQESRRGRYAFTSAPWSHGPGVHVPPPSSHPPSSWWQTTKRWGEGGKGGGTWASGPLRHGAEVHMYLPRGPSWADSPQNEVPLSPLTYDIAAPKEHPEDGRSGPPSRPPGPRTRSLDPSHDNASFPRARGAQLRPDSGRPGPARGGQNLESRMSLSLAPFAPSFP